MNFKQRGEKILWRPDTEPREMNLALDLNDFLVKGKQAEVW